MIFLVILLTIAFVSWIVLRIDLFAQSKRVTIDENDSVLITGCDSGIGRALAEHFAKRFRVIATCVNVDASSHLRQLGVTVVHLDLRDENLDSFFDEVKSSLSGRRLHAVINNAGVCILGEFDWLTRDQVDLHLKVNLGCIRVIHNLLDVIIPHRTRIINLSSVNGRVVYPGLSLYCATKFAIEAFSDALAIELEKFSVPVIKVQPGDFTAITNIMNKQFEYLEEMREKICIQNKAYHKVYMEKCKKMLEEGLYSISSKDFSELFRCFESALLAQRPRRLYRCGKLWYFMLVDLLVLLPERVRSKLLQKAFAFTELVTENN